MKAGTDQWSDGTKAAQRGLPGDLRQMVVWLVFLASGAIVASLAMRWNLPLPFCLLRESTGIPCPACGCTRSLAAWATLDIARAFRFNPLFFATCVGLAFWALLRTFEGFSPWRLSGRIRVLVVRLPLLRITIALLAVNWIYLYLTLPR